MKREALRLARHFLNRNEIKPREFDAFEEVSTRLEKIVPPDELWRFGVNSGVD